MMLQERPTARPNVYQVVREVCLMRGTEVPIKDVWTLADGVNDELADYVRYTQGGHNRRPAGTSSYPTHTPVHLLPLSLGHTMQHQ